MRAKKTTRDRIRAVKSSGHRLACALDLVMVKISTNDRRNLALGHSISCAILEKHGLYVSAQGLAVSPRDRLQQCRKEILCCRLLHPLVQNLLCCC